MVEFCGFHGVSMMKNLLGKVSLQSTSLCFRRESHGGHRAHEQAPTAVAERPVFTWAWACGTGSSMRSMAPVLRSQPPEIRNSESMAIPLGTSRSLFFLYGPRRANDDGVFSSQVYEVRLERIRGLEGREGRRNVGIRLR